MPHVCNLYSTYTEIKPEYPVQDFQNNESTPQIEEPPRVALRSGTTITGLHWGPPYRMKKEDGAAASSGEDSNPDVTARDTPRLPSDIDSQISLPRSYTLPREFRYWRRRPRLRDAHVPSNNSSDGDVDSADNDSDRRSNYSESSQAQAQAAFEGFRAPDVAQDEPYARGERRTRRAPRKQGPKPETKL
ncbi:hypothetical protein ACJJTC_015927 [Scirpophaga incertulas]